MDHRCGGALHANEESSRRHQNKATCAQSDTGQRASLSQPVLPAQSRALALSRHPINASFTGIPLGCVRRTGKYAKRAGEGCDGDFLEIRSLNCS